MDFGPGLRVGDDRVGRACGEGGVVVFAGDCLEDYVGFSF